MSDAKIKPIQIRFNTQYSKYFDAIYNSQLSNRKSDTGQIETDRPMLGPRAGTSRVGNSLILDWNIATAYSIGDIVAYEWVSYKALAANTWSTPPSTNWEIFTDGTSKEYFYTDRAWVRRQYRVFNKILYWLSNDTWLSLGSVGTNDVDFQNHRVPLNSSWLDSTSRTVAAVSSGPERVKKDAADVPATNNGVGSIILITSGIYKWCYAPVISWDVGTSEYVLGGAGIITALPAAVTYKRYDRIADVLQVSRWYSDLWELYFDGITPMAWLSGYTTDSLINVSAIATGKWVKKLISFNNFCWTFSGSTLYYTWGYPGNPLFFNYTWALTISSNGTIVDIFVYKTRLIVIGTGFIFSLTQDLKTDRHVTSFGGVRDGYVNTWSDVYIFTTAKTLVSLKETIAWVVEVKNDFGKEIENYTKNFLTDICFWYDSYRVYMYGASVSKARGVMCVLDTTYDFWFIYDNLQPSSIITEGWITYITDNHTDIVRQFDDTITTDVVVGTIGHTETYEQSLLIKEIDLADIFSQKIIDAIYFSCENYEQQFLVDVYTAYNNKNGKKLTKTISIDEIIVWGGALGENTLGENTFWQAWMLDIISVPRLKKIDYDGDSANLYKVVIRGDNGKYFYLSQIDIGVGYDGDPKAYFDTTNTI